MTVHREFLEVPTRDEWIAAMVKVLEESHCIFFMKHEAHDPEGRASTAAKFVDGIILKAIEVVYPTHSLDK